MPGNRKILYTIMAVISAIVAGCATTTAPSGWLPLPSEAQKEAYGVWIEVDTSTVPSRPGVQGEFVAVQSDSILVLTVDSLVIISSNRITHASLTTFSSQYNLLALWTLLGTLSTLSHGVVLMISAPAWIIVGTTATSAQSSAPMKSFPRNNWDQLKQYSRFPQGIPDGLDLQRLRLKPLRRHDADSSVVRFPIPERQERKLTIR